MFQCKSPLFTPNWSISIDYSKITSIKTSDILMKPLFWSSWKCLHTYIHTQMHKERTRYQKQDIPENSSLLNISFTSLNSFTMINFTSGPMKNVQKSLYLKYSSAKVTASCFFLKISTVPKIGIENGPGGSLLLIWIWYMHSKESTILVHHRLLLEPSSTLGKKSFFWNFNWNQATNGCVYVQWLNFFNSLCSIGYNSIIYSWEEEIKST